MATFVNAGSQGQSKRISGDEGSALTGTTTYHVLPDNIRYLEIEPFNFNAATTVAELLKEPYAIVLFTQDDFATAPTDFSQEIQDDDAVANAIDAMDTEANGDFIYVGSHVKYKGIRVLMADAQINGDSSVMTVKYWNGTALADISDTDGTASGGATFAQDGNITWTVPSDWVKGQLTDIESLTQAQQEFVPWANTAMYWTKIEVSIVLDASVDIEGMFLLSNETGIQFRGGRETRIEKQYGGYSALEMAAEGTGTPTCTVNLNAHGLNPHTELE